MAAEDFRGSDGGDTDAGGWDVGPEDDAGSREVGFRADALARGTRTSRVWTGCCLSVSQPAESQRQEVLAELDAYFSWIDAKRPALSALYASPLTASR